MKRQSKPRAIKVVASDKPAFESLRERYDEEDGLAPDAVEPDPKYVEEPAFESEEQLHSDMVRLVLERIEVKEAASESAKTFRRKIEAIDAQVESLARRLDTMGLIETFERVADCRLCGNTFEWASTSIDGEGHTVVIGGVETGKRHWCDGLAEYCECTEGQGLAWGDILVVRRRPNGELVDTRPVLASETQLALGVES
jgi:hypothetical protein